MAPKYLKIEEKIREKLSKELETNLKKSRVQILPNVEHEFDGVSQNQDILVEIKASKVPEKGKLRHTQLAEMCEASLLLLSIKDAEKRILAIADENFYEKFRNTMQGKAAEHLGIKIMLVTV